MGEALHISAFAKINNHKGQDDFLKILSLDQ